MEKNIMSFCGCEIILKSNHPNKEIQPKQIERAETEIKRIFEKEFAIPTEDKLRKIVEKDLGIKKHWLWGWIKV